MDSRSCRAFLPLVLLFALGTSMITGCSEVCGARVQVAGPAAIERAIDGLLSAGFQEERDVQLKREGERYFRFEGRVVAIPGHSDSGIISLTFWGNKPMLSAEISIYGRMVEHLRVAVGASNVKADTVNSCSQTLL